MKLESVYRHREYVKVLYDLLGERTPEQSISHKTMPTIQEHIKFMESKPYQCWYIILADEKPVGSIYITKQREIGIFIFKHSQGYGHAEWAVREVMRKWPGRFLANINPANEASIGLFKKFGAKLIQHTYEVPLCS